MIGVGTQTNKGKILWMDNPWVDSTGNLADILVKTDLPENGQNFSWHRLSQLIKSEEMYFESKEGLTPIKPEIEFDAFMKADIRACLILSVTKVPKKDRLLQLWIDTGFDKRMVITNLGSHYKEEDLFGKIFPFILNLPTATIAGIESTAMIIASEGENNKPVLMEVNAPVGSKIV